MFMKINFIFVCYLTISIKSAEINSNFELDESPRKNDSNTNRNDQKMSSQFSPNTAITVILNISTILPQKTSNSVNLNSFTSTNTRKETLLVNTTYTTLKTTENPENPEKPKTNNNTHPIDVENSNKKRKHPENSSKSKINNNTQTINPKNPNKAQTEHPKSSSKTKKNENAPTNSENSDKSQTKDQKTPGNIKPHKETESTNSSHHDKSLTTKQIETTIHETVLNPEESKKVDPFKMKTTGSEKSQDSRVDNKLKKDEIKNSEDTNHFKRQKSQNLGETNDNSSAHFMIFIFFGLLFTIVAYVAFQKRKKIMAYVIEGRRRTSRSRRTSGGKDSKVSYKPLDSEDQEAGKNSYKYVY